MLIRKLNKGTRMQQHKNLCYTLAPKSSSFRVLAPKGDVVTANDYYPFGMTMPGRKYTLANSSYRYGFNGKENDNDVKIGGNQQDYGMRIYDNRLGRFLSIDPLSRQYSMLTPYQFASNSTISGTDLDGLEYYF
jgi:RHS repeat-associated protein